MRVDEVDGTDLTQSFTGLELSNALSARLSAMFGIKRDEAGIAITTDTESFHDQIQ